MAGSDVNRRHFLEGAGLAAAAAGALAMNSPTKAAAMAGAIKSKVANRCNIVVFMPDELRADALACYGNPVCKTPNFDKLASQGTLFENCHVQYPVCGASRCSILTGWPTSVRGHRSLYYFLRPEEPNLFRYLKQSGYDVFWFGKNDALAAESFYDSVTYWSENAGFRTAGNFPDSIGPGNTFLFPPQGDRRKTHDYALVKAAIEIIERKQQDKPFCLFIPINNPHPPYAVPVDFYNLYTKTTVDVVPPIGRRKPSYHQGIREFYDLQNLPASTFHKVRQVYFGMVSYADWLLGEVMEALDRTGRSADTALMTFSDHGDYAGDYGLVEKWPSGLEDCLTHVPLIIRAPGGVAGHRVKEMNEVYDVMATSIALAGTETNHTHFSRSLVPQLQGHAGDSDRCAFAEGGYNIYEPQCYEPVNAIFGIYGPKVKLQNLRPDTISRSAMVRTHSHKLIMRPDGVSELYDLTRDPHETRNLYGDMGTGNIQTTLTGKLLDHYIRTTGIAPKDKDQRASPLFITSREAPPADWQRSILDK
jgi:arylsulfatase A-like enzyme